MRLVFQETIDIEAFIDIESSVMFNTYLPPKKMNFDSD